MSLAPAPNRPEERHCAGFACNAPIHNCNGAVKGQDFAEAAIIEPPIRCPECVRELCGLCMLRYIWVRYGVMRRRDLSVE